MQKKSVRLQLKQTATNHMAGQVRFNRADKSPPARHPHRARNAIPQNHVEGGGKRSCQVSPTVTGKGRSAARPNPTRLHWVECNQGERKEGRAAAGTESSQAQHHQWAGGLGAPRSGPSPTKAVAQAASGAESHSMSIRGSPEIAQ
jgi:hypothetical protein